MWEWLAGQDIEKIGNTLIVVITGLAVLFGLKKPAAPAGPEKPPGSMAVEVAADFFDAESIAALTREVTGLAFAMTSLGKIGAQHVTAVEASTDAILKAVELAEEYREDQEDEKERRLERRAEHFEMENQRLRDRLAEAERQEKINPMRRD